MAGIPQALARHVGGFPGTFWWLWAGGLVNALANFVFPFLALFLTARGFSPSEAGLVAALFGLANVVAGPLGGGLADRVGRRPTLLGSLCLSAGAAAAIGFAAHATAIAALVFLFGLGVNVARPAISATVADVVPAPDRARAFGLVYWASNLGIGASMALGGFVAARTWRGLFLADAASTLVFAAFVWRHIGETRPAAGGGRVDAAMGSAHPPGPASLARGEPTADDGEQGRPAAPAPRRGGGVRRASTPRAAAAAAAPAASGGYGAVLRDRRFVPWLALHLGWALVFTQFLAAAPIDMARRGLSAAEIGPVLAVNGLLIAVVQPWVTAPLARVQVARVLAAGAALVGAGYGLYALCSTAWQFALATAVWTVGELAYLPVAMAHVAELSPADLRGRYQGAYGVSWGVAATLSPIVGPAVLERAGAPALWGGCLALALAVAAGQLALAAAPVAGAVERERPSR